MFYIVVIENNVSLIDLTILTILDDLGNLVANVISNVTASAFYRRTGRRKRMKQKQLFIKTKRKGNCTLFCGIMFKF